MTAETSNARGEWVLERLRGVLEHGKMGDKCLIAPDLVTAAIAALSAPQPAAVDDVVVERAVAAVMSAPAGISVESYVRIVLEAALATKHQEPTT